LNNGHDYNEAHWERSCNKRHLAELRFELNQGDEDGTISGSNDMDAPYLPRHQCAKVGMRKQPWHRRGVHEQDYFDRPWIGKIGFPDPRCHFSA